MILYFNPNNNEVSINPRNGVSINIETEISILKEVKTGLYNKKRDISGNIVYSDSTGKETMVGTAFNKVGKPIANVNNKDIYDGTVVVNTPVYIEDVTSKIITLNENNCRLFNADEVLNKEFENILNDSEYSIILKNILSDVDLKESTFKMYDKYRVILNKSDKIIMNIGNIKYLTQNIKLANIDNELTIAVNNKFLTKENDMMCDLGFATDNLTIEITNNTDRRIIIVNPYLLCR